MYTDKCIPQDERIACQCGRFTILPHGKPHAIFRGFYPTTWKATRHLQRILPYHMESHMPSSEDFTLPHGKSHAIFGGFYPTTWKVTRHLRRILPDHMESHTPIFSTLLIS